DLRDLYSFPTRRSSDLGVVLYGVDERFEGDKFLEFLAAVGVDDQFAGERGIVGRGDVEDRAVHGQKAAMFRRLVKNLFPEARARSEEHTSELQSLRHLV